MDPIHRRVVVAVIGGHLLICLYLAFASEGPPVHTTKPLIVNTILPIVDKAPKQQKPAVEPIRPEPPPPPQPVKPKPLEPGPPPSKSPPSSKPGETKPPPKKPTKQSAERERLQKELLRELEEIEGKSAPRRAASASPQPLQLSIDRAPEESDGYEDQLVAFLQRTLHLPDLGAVRLQLSVRPDGSLSKLLVIKAESEKNRKYLEENLPRLRFPPPSGGKERNLLMTFFNEVK